MSRAAMSQGKNRDEFNLQEAFALGRETIRGLLLVNGGGAIALLSFYGDLLSKADFSLGPQSKALLTASLTVFAVGLFLAVFATALGYATQVAWGAAVKEESKIERIRKWAFRLQIVTIAVAFLSGLCFLAGIIAAAQALQLAGAP